MTTYQHIPIFNIEHEGEDTTLPENTQNNEEIAKRTSHIRSDKCRDIKFPITKEEQIRLRSICKKADTFYKKIHGNSQKLTQTHFNTLLLRYALENEIAVNWDKPYSDTKIYMHTKPTEKEYEQIGGPDGLSIKNAVSDRKAVYFLVMTVLELLESKEEYHGIIR